jgi:membrane-anchored mycosin MYCP
MTRPTRPRLGRALTGGIVTALLAGTGLAVTTAGPAAAAECTDEKAVYVKEEPPALQRLNARYAWTLATGKGVTVAVVDSGVDARNAHFKGALTAGRSFVPGVKPTTDAVGHGTAIAGQIAARLVRGSGVIGLAPASKILPVQVFYADDEQSRQQGVGPRPDRIAAGIRYAADRGAKVINVSMSTPTSNSALRASVEYATRKGSLVVASAGNRNVSENKTDGPRYPAAYPQAVAVAAVDRGDYVGQGSIHGPHVDVAAPGTSILTTFKGAGDCVLEEEEESTSFATAYVSAAAALLAERFPTEGPAGWKHRLEATASREQRDRRDDSAGWGLIQPYEALTALTDGTVSGPVAPGSTRPPVVAAAKPAIDLRTVPDPHAPERTAALWWSLLGVSALLALALGGALRAGRRRPTA